MLRKTGGFEECGIPHDSNLLSAANISSYSDIRNRSMSACKTSLLVCIVAGLLCGCGGGTQTTPPTSSPPPVTPSTFGHVVLVVEENHDYSQVIGDSLAPY